MKNRSSDRATPSSRYGLKNLKKFFLLLLNYPNCVIIHQYVRKNVFYMTLLFFQALNRASNNLGISTANPELVISKKPQVEAPNRKIYERNIDKSMTLSSRERHLFQFPSLDVIDIVRIATTPPDPQTFESFL
ncbi:TPA: hypothetical protein ACTXXA_002156 [Legionella anisa]